MTYVVYVGRYLKKPFYTVTAAIEACLAAVDLSAILDDSTGEVLFQFEQGRCYWWSD